MRPASVSVTAWPAKSPAGGWCSARRSEGGALRRRLLRRVSGEVGELCVERTCECGPRLAPRLERGQVRVVGDDAGVTQVAQHRAHEQIAGGEIVLEILACAERRGESRQPVAR